MTASWYLIIGSLLLLMALLSTLVDRMPLSTGVIYLLIGFALGPSAAGMLRIDPVTMADPVELLCEITVLISLFTIGLKIRRPLAPHIWRTPVRLATLSMLLTIAAVALLGWAWLDLPVGAAILLGAILAPTDPVLASDIQLRDPDDVDHVRFSLTTEGGLNDGMAAPFVLLGLGLLGLHELGPDGLAWFARDLLWAPVAGLACGWLCGRGVAHLTIFLRRHRLQLPGLEEFIALGLVAFSHGLALMLDAYGFLAVFAAGMAMRRLEMLESGQAAAARPPAPALAPVGNESPSAELVDTVLGFNERFEHVAEVASVLLLGSLLSAGYYSLPGLLLGAALLLVIRPLSVIVGLAGIDLLPRYRVLYGWFGIRGVGSMYYLAFAIAAGLPRPLAAELTSLVVTAVALSIVLHGVSATPLMNLHVRRTRATLTTAWRKLVGPRQR